MNAALITIGTELTRGELVDSNSAYLAEKLTSLGHHVTAIVTVDDDEERIVRALLVLSRDHELIVATGGLGPTTDDKTSACAARALGVPLVRNQEAHRRLLALLESRGRMVTPSNEKQADFPEGATVLTNTEGSAPGFSIPLGRAACFFMPGVPAEMKVMFEKQVVPQLPMPQARVAYHRLRTFGLPEAEVNDRLVGIEEAHAVEIGYRASNSEIEVKVLARQRASESTRDLEARARSVTDLVKARLGSSVYTEGTASLPEVLGELLSSRSLSLGVAESCTGGLVSELLTAAPGASAFFSGGIVSYANHIKQQVLGVDEEILGRFGAVSEPVARQMAEGARRVLQVDIALALTGVAGPSGGSSEKPVGLVHWAVATPRGTFALHQIFTGDRRRIQARAALSGMWSVRSALLEQPLVD